MRTFRSLAWTTAIAAALLLANPAGAIFSDVRDKLDQAEDAVDKTEDKARTPERKKREAERKAEELEREPERRERELRDDIDEETRVSD